MYEITACAVMTVLSLEITACAVMTVLCLEITAYAVMTEKRERGKWWPDPDLNRGPADYESDALTN